VVFGSVTAQAEPDEWVEGHGPEGDTAIALVVG